MSTKRWCGYQCGRRRWDDVLALSTAEGHAAYIRTLYTWVDESIKIAIPSRTTPLMLISLSADPTLVKSDDKTAQDLAYSHGHTEIGSMVHNPFSNK